MYIEVLYILLAATSLFIGIRRHQKFLLSSESKTLHSLRNSFNMKLVATLVAAFAIMVLALQAEAKRSTGIQAFCPPNIGKDGCGG